MIRYAKYSSLALPLVFVISACGSPEAQQEEKTEAATLGQPAFEDRSAAPAEAQAEARTLSEHLASGNLPPSEAAVVLEDLDRLVNDNIIEFPDDMRAGLTEDIQSARTALESNDMDGLQEAATRIQGRLSGSASTSNTG